MTHKHREITGSETITADDGGIYLIVTNTATVTIPKDTFIHDDEIYIYRDTANAVDVVAATGVTLRSVGLNIDQCQLATFVHIGDNEWIGFGGLS